MKHILLAACVSAALFLFAHSPSRAQSQAQLPDAVLCITTQGFDEIPTMLTVYEGETVVSRGAFTETCSARPRGSVLRLVFEVNGTRRQSAEIILTGQGMDIAIVNESGDGDTITIHYTPRPSPQPKKKSE